MRYVLLSLTLALPALAAPAPSLKPIPGGGGQFTVEDAQTAGHLVLRPGVQLEHGRLSSDGGTLSTTHMLGAMGLGPYLQMGMDVPIHVLEGETAAGDLRIVPKARLFRHGDISGAMTFGVALPTSDVDGEGQLALDPKLVLAADAGAFAMAFNVGYRWIPGGHNDAFSYGVGATVPLWRDRVQMLLEARGEKPSDGQQDGGLEGLGGVRIKLGDLELTFGGGGGLVDGRGAPDWRVVAGAGWRWHDDDLDNDGIADADDACPAEPEDRDGFADNDGCPEPDNDFDRIADAYDQCPDTAEVHNGYLDRDGCPDVAPAARFADRDDDGIADSEDACALGAGAGDPAGHHAAANRGPHRQRRSGD